MSSKKKKGPDVEMVTIRNLHNNLESPMPKDQWEAQKLSLKGKFELVKGPKKPPEVKALAEKLKDQAGDSTTGENAATNGDNSAAETEAE